jgi:hypothetical protein
LLELLNARDIAALRSLFPDERYDVPPDETLRLELARGSRGMFNLIHHESQFKADIHLAARDPLHTWALANRRRSNWTAARYGWRRPNT